MTAVLIDGTGEGQPSRVQVTFILTDRHPVSIRYADPAPFRGFAETCDRGSLRLASPDAILVALHVLRLLEPPDADCWSRLMLMKMEANESSVFLSLWSPRARHII